MNAHVQQLHELGRAMASGEREAAALRADGNLRNHDHPHTDDREAPLASADLPVVLRHHESGVDQPGAYDLADGVTDEQFDAAIEEAKAEGNVSHASFELPVEGER